MAELSRQQIVELMLTATREEEVQEAWDLAVSYLEAHPRDRLVLTAGEVMVMRAQALGLIETPR